MTISPTPAVAQTSGSEPFVCGQKPLYVVVPLSMAPFASSFLDAINGYATGGSTRCLEAIHEEGSWLLSTPPHQAGDVSSQTEGE